MQIKLIFTTKVAHLNLIMKVRVFGTRKWPISTVNNELACSRLSDGNDDALVNGTRKSEREPGKRERWREKRKGAPPLPSSLPFNVRARAFSNSRKRLQHAKKVVSDSPGLMDFTIGLVNSVLNLPEVKYSKYSRNSTSHKKFGGGGASLMTFGLVNASFSLPEWQAVKMTFFAHCDYLGA